MTTAQIAATAAATAELLELTTGPLAPTSTPIRTELVWGGAIEITLHAVRANSGDDVNIRTTIDAHGDREGYELSYYSHVDHGMTAWLDIADLDEATDLVAAL